MHPRDTLKAWLADREIKAAEFARRIDYDRGNFHRLLNEADAWPSLDLARKIERETGGAIPMALWADAKAGTAARAA